MTAKPTSQPSWVSRSNNWILSILFCFFIFLPLSDTLLQWAPEVDLGEKRVLVQASSLREGSIESLPERFDAFYNDRFGFRSVLIRGYRLLTSRGLGLSTEKVLIGKEGWLYYSGPVIDDYMGKRENPQDHFDRWKEKLESWTNWFQERGKQYHFVVAPNKVSIYPEFLPDRIRKRGGRTRMDRLKEHLANHSRIPLLDLREPLREGKDLGLLYHPNDSHWTDLGAFIAYQRICREISSSTPAFPIDCGSLENFETTEILHVGDLGEMIGFGNAFASKSLQMVPKSPFVRARLMERPDGADWLWHGMILKENPAKEGTLLVFHDSFTRHGLIDYLGQEFKRSVFVYLRRPDFESVKFLVEREKPDVVVEQMAERFLSLWLKDEDLFYEEKELGTESTSTPSAPALESRTSSPERLFPGQ